MAPSSSIVTSVYYDVIDSPIYELMLACTDVGLVRVAFVSEQFDDVLARLSEQLGTTPRRDSGPLRATAEELREYFAGERHSFDVTLDRRLSGTSYLARVQLLLSDIPYGTTKTYKELAEISGHSGAVRAVGGACASNPIPVLVPCHRVVRSDGGLGGYRGGLDAKQILLDLEKQHRG